ncbi:MAG TPA: hypothetical protein VGG75_42530 [Trebonia sp.]|jgi:hypothetical protein
MSKPKTRTEYAEETARLAEENAAMRDLLAAIHEGDLPMPCKAEDNARAAAEAERRFSYVTMAAYIPEGYLAESIRHEAGRLRGKWETPLTYTAMCEKGVDGQTSTFEVNGHTYTAAAVCFLARGHDGDCKSLAQVRAEKNAANAAEQHKPERCPSRPYPDGSEGDDGTVCVLPKGHEGDHWDGPELEGLEDIPAGTQVRSKADGQPATVVRHSARSGKMLLNFGTPEYETHEVCDFEIAQIAQAAP